jgi:hypothetical protein
MLCEILRYNFLISKGKNTREKNESKKKVIKDRVKALTIKKSFLKK